MWSSSWILPLFCLFFFPFCFNESSFFFEWMVFFGEIGLSVSFFVDCFSLVFFLTVSLVSFSVSFYSIFYMLGDVFKKKFIVGLFTFVVSMIFLIFSSNLFWVMIGWDGLGLSSFFLILHFQNWKSMNSAMVTFLSNRLGDCFFLLTLTWSVGLSQWDYFFLPFCGKLLLVFGAFSKSAQLPFSAWLPLAMAAPTPVSSLVHSSTLVTAGVFLLIRFKGSFDELGQIIQTFSFLTILLAGLSSFGEMDLKKIVALSTLSHIGLMILSTSMGMFMGAFIHLILHAFFKSLLFMVSGIVIHLNSNFQDVRKIGLLGSKFLVSCPLVVSLLSMVGAPFLSGFVSKEILYSQFMVSGVPIFFFWISIFFTSAYSFRLLGYLFNNSCLSPLIYSTDFFLEGWVFFSLSVFSICGSVLVKSLFSSLEFSMLCGAYQSFFFGEAKVILFIFLFFGLGLGISFSSFVFRSKVWSFYHEMWFILSFTKFLQKSVFFFSLQSMFKVFTKGVMETLIFSFPEKLGFFAKLNLHLLNTLILFEELSLVFLTLNLMIWSWNILFRMELI